MEATSIYKPYPLSPLQQGMLFHNLSLPGSGVDIQQTLCKIRESVNHNTFRTAWEMVIKRHAVLRTRFSWEGLNEPIQVVEPNVTLPLDYFDWRHLTPVEWDKRTEEILLQDRLRGFDMSEAPMMRVFLFELGASEYWFIWTFHHALMDGIHMARFYSAVQHYIEQPGAVLGAV